MKYKEKYEKPPCEICDKKVENLSIDNETAVTIFNDAVFARDSFGTISIDYLMKIIELYDITDKEEQLSIIKKVLILNNIVNNNSVSSLKQRFNGNKPKQLCTEKSTDIFKDLIRKE